MHFIECIKCRHIETKSAREKMKSVKKSIKKNQWEKRKTESSNFSKVIACYLKTLMQGY